MAADLGVSVALINLTITAYLVVANVAPAFMGDLADQGGRRPAYLLMFVLVVDFFWVLVIMTGAYLVVVALFLPETQRKVVGSGSIPTRGNHWSLFDCLSRTARQRMSKMAGLTRLMERGKVLDWNVKRFGDYRRGQTVIFKFPIEEARLIGIYSWVVSSAIGAPAYGVTLKYQTASSTPKNLLRNLPSFAEPP
ncbi:hypothetical protein B0T25DRAFT_521766 [Lasiosphaeria hispida]|uniref:Major facilitator superfamily (MFS) profile domain-containing protein n=1 Tax=Lasiosphaeria hispida TaxID=260671 RepID=A0AAJ0H8B3_9PEZI|nr:hypothetical protein B0T25DRAFT_521766 [Lasiosphaeria hispida]